MTDKNPPIKITFKEFLENSPPGQEVQISDNWVRKIFGGKEVYYLKTSVLNLHCNGDDCSGRRRFNPNKNETPSGYTFLTYTCRDCQTETKTFCLLTKTNGTAYKFGELPRFGERTSPKLLKLLGDNKYIFLKGRRSENRSLGIGALTYYRRVVENSKNEILDEIIKVAKALGNYEEIIVELEAAKKEIQFSKAINNVKQAIPETLLLNGQNPLTLLHSALSEGVHELSDEECLEIAQDIRLILAEFMEKVKHAMKNKSDIATAVNRLAKRRSKKK